MRTWMQGMMLAALAAATAGCNSSTTAPLDPIGTVAFTSPAGGETFQIGETVALAWSCPDCANVPAGDSLEVFAYDGADSYLVNGAGQLTDSMSWVAGTTLQSVALLPGTYQIVAQDAAGYYTAQSRFFQLKAAAP